MRQLALIAVLAAGAVAAQVSADVVELQYDNGVRAMNLAWYTGAGHWVGNDFDLSTLKTRHNVVRQIKLFTSPYWPDNNYDGFRLALFSFAGGVPGSRLWPAAGPRFVKPTGGEGFKEFWVDYFLNTPEFVAAVEQYYDYPNCDPYFCDSNPTFLGHSWQKEGSAAWTELTGIEPYPYRNLMLRVMVFLDYSEIAVTPSSLGRVKALYY